MENQENIKKTTEEIAKEKEQKTRQINLETRIIGWVGTFLLITAYGLNSLGYLDSQNLFYPLINLLAALLLAIRVYADKNWSNLFLEGFWGAIAIVSIIKFFTN